jgi:hypothetical protein
VVFFFVGIIQWDDEFYESPGFVIKLPPTWQWYFPSTGMDDPQSQEEEEMNAEYYRVKSLNSELGAFGSTLAFGLVELLAIAVFIKPVFSKRRKYIVSDVLLILASVFVSGICYGLWGFWETRASSVILLCTALTAHYVLLRLVRPVKKYGKNEIRDFRTSAINCG